MSRSPHRLPSLFTVVVGSPGRLAGGLGAVALAALGAAALWWSPLSPVALDRPAELAAQGDMPGAIAAYEELAESIAPKAVRQDAAWHAAQLAAIQPGAGAEAESLLQGFLARWPDAAQAPEAHVQLAQLAQQDQARIAEAVAHLNTALDAAPDHADAGRWLLTAARLRRELGDADGALAVLTEATARRPLAARAWLGIGRLRIADDAAAAYDAYQKALDAAANPPEARLARLGMATALEHLEGRDAALAEVDEALAAEGDDPALRRRQERLRAAR
jgi:tetratricopeptide (TPR) repeat protein